MKFFLVLVLFLFFLLSLFIYVVHLFTELCSYLKRILKYVLPPERNSFSDTSALPVVAYTDTSGNIIFYNGRTGSSEAKIAGNMVQYKDDILFSDSQLGFYYFSAGISYSLNIPVFSSRTAASLFLQNGEFTGCENALQYDTSALPDALPDNFAPFTGQELDPSVFNSLFPALVSALQAAFPQPQPNPDPDAEPEPVPLPDPVAGTAVFNQVVTDTATDVAAEASPQPNPNPNPDVEMGSYKTDLTMVFPFCLPFDFVRLLDALDAEPVTPVFEFPFVVEALDINITVKLDMSFLEPAMKIFRIGETVCFIIGLIFVTQKVIKW